MWHTAERESLGDVQPGEGEVQGCGAKAPLRATEREQEGSDRGALEREKVSDGA